MRIIFGIAVGVNVLETAEISIISAEAAEDDVAVLMARTHKDTVWYIPLPDGSPSFSKLEKSTINLIPFQSEDEEHLPTEFTYEQLEEIYENF